MTLGDGEPETDASRLAIAGMLQADKGLQNRSELIVGNARAVVVDGDFDDDALDLRYGLDVGSKSYGIADQVREGAFEANQPSVDHQVMWCDEFGIVARVAGIVDDRLE
jgi:hypothetical protein